MGRVAWQGGVELEQVQLSPCRPIPPPCSTKLTNHDESTECTEARFSIVFFRILLSPDCSTSYQSLINGAAIVSTPPRHSPTTHHGDC